MKNARSSARFEQWADRSISRFAFLVPLFALAMACGGTLSAEAGVSITSPQSGATVTSPVQISASAAGHRVATLQLYIDSQLVYSVNGTSLSTSQSLAAGSHNLTIQATDSKGHSSRSSETITVASSPTTPSPVVVSISPTAAVLQVSKSQQFSSAVSGTTNTAITWKVNGVVGGNSTVGTITSSGDYVVPATVPSGGGVTVTAQSQADPTKSANAAVTVTSAPTAVTVSVSPTTASVSGGATQQFNATVSGTTNTGVTWTVNGVQGGNSTYGSITSTGLYTAPGCPTVSGASVTAISSYDSSATASSAVTLTGPGSSSATHYVSAATGNDSNDGSACRPWATIQKAANAVNPGDTVVVGDGTYSSCSTGSSIAYVTRSGSSGSPITFKSENKWGAKLVGTGSCQYGFQLYGSYITVEDFDISGFAVDAGGQGVILAGGSNHLITGNNIHNIANYNSTSGFGMNGIYVYQNSSYDTVDGNVFHDIGRTGSYTYWADHGIYSDGASNQTYENNVFYNITHGWGIQIGSHPQSNVLMINNTFDINNPNAAGDIVMESVCTGCRIANNIFYNPSTSCVYNYTSLSGGSYTIDDNACTLGTIVSPSGSFYTTSNNHLSVPSSGLLVSPSNHDYHLAGGSSAIDVGSSTKAPNHDDDGQARPQGAGYDLGAYEYQ